MKRRTYFLVNDTRYDNHHGCLTVVANLHKAMAQRGWQCTGSLPVSAPAAHLNRHTAALEGAGLVLINGEGSLHHDRRNARRLLNICRVLTQTHPTALLNTVWQDNDAEAWGPVLQSLKAVYARDRKSQEQLEGLGVAAGYAPDLTFYDYPRFPSAKRTGLLCTDSVLNSWTETALQLCEREKDLAFMTLFTGRMCHTRGAKDWHKRVKYSVYPALSKHLGISVPPRYRAIPHAIPDTHAFLEELASARSICVARYHALCFAIQQQTPFIAISSNSHKSEALIEEVGLPVKSYKIAPSQADSVVRRLNAVADDSAEFMTKAEAFTRDARQRIDRMLDAVTGTAKAREEWAT
jgi:hypothetical protein